MKKKKFYITTTIPYANAPPHIGFALEIVQADVIARWHRLLGEDVFFLTGTDEHGSKNYRLAKEEGLTPQQFVDRNASYFKELTKLLNISNTEFIRTTDKKIHWPGVLEIWKTLAKKGDIYKKKYEGYYCSGCERFVTEKDLVDGKCPNHVNLNPEFISEENYFFKLSKYSDKIKGLIKEDKLKIIPTKWKNDFLSLIKDGLTDVSFSRDKKHLPWGIPVPSDENQVMYVWADALTNYLTGIGYPNKKYKKYWPADLHFVGKDMLRFHTGIWPGMLLSAKIELPKKVIVHGFLTVDGQKMSKSLGNVINPIDLVKVYSADSIRYYLMRTFPFGEDGDFSINALVERNNNELANKLGNLVSRVTTLAASNGIKKAPNKLIKKLKFSEINKNIDNFEFDKALSLIFQFIDECNTYVQENKIWETKDQKKLYELVDSIRIVSILLWPFIPESSEKIAKILNFKIENIKQIKINIKFNSISKSEVLFHKIDEIKPDVKPEKKEMEEVKKESKDKVELDPCPACETVPFEEFKKLDLRVGKIIKAEPHPNADKLYVLLIDLGHYGEDRQVVAGLKQHYKMEELVGREVVMVVNLQPAVIRGVESNGMLLAASNGDVVGLLKPDKDIVLGAKIR